MNTLFNVSEVTIGYKRKFKHGVNVRNSREVAEVFRQIYTEDTIEHREKFSIMLLANNMDVLGISEVSSGGITECTVDVRVIFQTALLANATQIILCHNHPSGNLKPSGVDLEITKKLIEAGKVLSIKVLDHIIITEDSYHSMADEFDLSF